MKSDGRQRLAHQFGALARFKADRDIGFAHRNIKIGVVDQKFDIDIGVAFDKARKPWHQPGIAEGERRRDPQRALGLAAIGVEERLGLSRFGINAARRLEQRFSHFGQAQAAGVAQEQFNLELLLEKRDLPRKCSRADVEVVACLAKASRPRHPIKSFAIIPFTYVKGIITKSFEPLPVH